MRTFNVEITGNKIKCSVKFCKDSQVETIESPIVDGKPVMAYVRRCLDADVYGDRDVQQVWEQMALDINDGEAA